MRQKAVKIFCTYFGHRRGDFNTPDDMKLFFDTNIDNEISIDNGIDTDIIIVNNKCGVVESDQFVLKYKNLKTKNGSIIVEERDNIGGSFGAYFEMFLKYKNDYDYWFFCEDDVLIFKQNYMKDFIDFIDSDEKLGFVCLAPISERNIEKIHSGGGIGLSTTEKFKIVYNDNKIVDILNNMVANPSYGRLQKDEELFTTNFILNEMNIKNHPNYSSLAENYTKHSTQPGFATPENLEKEFIYKVGF